MFFRIHISLNILHIKCVFFKDFNKIIVFIKSMFQSHMATRNFVEKENKLDFLLRVFNISVTTEGETIVVVTDTVLKLLRKGFH